MEEHEAYKKLTRSILRINIMSLVLATIIGLFSTVLHGFIAFWINIHLISYAIYLRNY